MSSSNDCDARHYYYSECASSVGDSLMRLDALVSNGLAHKLDSKERRRIVYIFSDDSSLHFVKATHEFRVVKPLEGF